MKNILIIHAHPEAQSFCSSLKNTAEAYFKAQYQSVEVRDLYGMNFNPVGSKNDFSSIQNPDFFKYQIEQVHAFQNGLFAEDVKAEMEAFEKADVLIFNFPIWWFGLPAILKGWVDRVFAMGFAYGAGKGVYDNGAFKNKKALCCITTGGPEQAYGSEGKNGDLETILYPIQHGIFYFVGMQALPPFVSFSPARKSKEELEQELERYKNYLGQIDTLPLVY
jgi:NAD(P)H dehydrogenase (quinone)